MKSEERHEIETNELAKIITSGSDKIAPYASYIIYGLLGIAALWAIIRLSTGSMNAKELQAWDSYTIATLPGKFDSNSLQAAASQYAGEAVGELAQIAWADSQLAQGCQNYFTNKKQAMENLSAAQAEYEKLAESAADKNLRGRAQLGVAKVLEAKGEVTESIAAYEKVTGAFSEMADTRAESLGEMNAQEYAGWLATAEGARRPGNFGSGARPDFSADALGLPGGDAAAGGVADGEDFLEMLRKFQEAAPGEESDRYEGADQAEEPAGDNATETSTEESTSETADDGAPAEEAGGEPEAESSATDSTSPATEPESTNDSP